MHLQKDSITLCRTKKTPMFKTFVEWLVNASCSLQLRCVCVYVRQDKSVKT